MADSFSSLGVIVAGAVILWFGVLWIDSVMTLVVAVFTIWHSLPDIRRSIHILMEGAPSDVETAALLAELQSVSAWRRCIICTYGNWMNITARWRPISWSSRRNSIDGQSSSKNSSCD